MPYFIDRHELCDFITPESAAQRNVEDLKIQHKFNCRKLSYWFDEKRQTAFCLFEAPNKECLVKMHQVAHHNVPNQIIEVDKHIIDSFLKQIQHLPNLDKLELPGAMPTFLACNLASTRLNRNWSELKIVRKIYITSVKEAVGNSGGNVISQVGSFFLIAFQSGPTAISCALKINKKFYSSENVSEQKHQLKIGVSGGIQDDRQVGNIKASVSLAKRLCYMAHEKVLVTLEVKNMFQSESMKVIIKGNRIKSVSPDDVNFITQLLNYMEGNWKNPNLHVNNLEAHLGCSKSQVYRKMVSLAGQSPNAFIKEYRLNRATELLRQKKGNISEVAFVTGFNSPSYFTKCFQKEYGLNPSEYLTELAQL